MAGLPPLKVTWRKNVLVLVGMGYGLMVLVFLSLLAVDDMTVSDSYSIIDGPIMALIGGSLAIAKDLIDGDKSEAAERGNDQDQPGKADPAPDENNGE